MMQQFAKNAVSYLPWGMRKLAAFIALHGYWKLLISKQAFRGVYRSFDEIPGGVLSNQHELARFAAEGARSPRIDQASGLPVLRLNHQLLPLVAAILSETLSPLRILDFGGAAGVDYQNVLHALPNAQDIKYHVVDLPAVCGVGRRKWRDDARISFHETVPDAEARFDLTGCCKTRLIEYVEMLGVAGM
jgi:putative methyltransferase (TIGR04325 family)